MKLQEVCEFIVDCPHSTANDEGEGYPLIRTPNIGKGRLILDGVHRVSERVYNQRNARGIPQDDDLIFAREAPAGNVAIIKNGEKVCLGQRTVLIRPNKSIADPDYLTYYLLAPKQQYGLTGTANGATVAHVNLPTIRNLEIKLPSIEAQKATAKILKDLDNLVENNQKQIKLLEEAAQRLYKEWFTGTDVCDLDNTTLSEIVTFKRGKTITKAQTIEGNIPVVAGGLEPAYYHNEANTTAPVITVSGSGANAGFARMYFEDVFASDCSFADSGSTQYLFFVYCFLKENKSQLDALQKGSAQPHVYAKDINAMVMKSIPKQSLEQFCDIVKPYFEMMGNLEKRSKSAVEARDRLLPKLMNGEIEI